MSSTTRLLAGTAAAALATTGAARADVTAMEVWENWKSSLQLTESESVTIGSETMEGSVLTVTDISVSADDGMSSFSTDMGTLMFEEVGDGTVRVILPDSYTMSFADSGTEVDLSVTQDEVDMLVSGTPEEMNYAFTADSMVLSIDEVREGGEIVTEGEMMFTLNDLSGDYTSMTDDLRNVTSALSVASIDALVDVVNPANPEDIIVLSGQLSNLAFDGAMTLPLNPEEVSGEELFQSGFGVNGTYGVESANYIIDINADGTTVAGTVSTGGVGFELNLNEESFLYDVATQDLAISMVTSDLPFPIEVSVEEYGIGVGLPLAATEEPQDFAFLINLLNLSINDEILGLLDPGGALERGPITMILDITGSGRLDYSLTDPEGTAAIDAGAVPGELYALNLDDLTLEAAGASVNGAGGFTFDNSDMETFDGLPRPEGSVTIDIVGLNQLMGALVQLGVLPQDQMMMAQMMIGMFAEQTGEDSLTTTIEVNDQGHLIANGQRLQ